MVAPTFRGGPAAGGGLLAGLGGALRAPAPLSPGPAGATPAEPTGKSRERGGGVGGVGGVAGVGGVGGVAVWLGGVAGVGGGRVPSISILSRRPSF